jgi:hypothetical protein
MNHDGDVVGFSKALALHSKTASSKRHFGQVLAVTAASPAPLSVASISRNMG